MFILNEELIDLRAKNDACQEIYGDCQTNRYGLHLSKTDDVLSQILFLRDAGAGVFPIHADIPTETARSMARQAGCNRFVTDAGIEEIAGATTDRRSGVLVQMSSGTTGAPKVITRTWHEIELEIANYTKFFTQARDMTPVIACPVTHSYGLIAGVMVALHRGHVPVVIDALNPKYILRRMREISDPLLYTSPAMLHTLATLLPAEQRLNAAMTSGTVLSEPWFKRIRAKTRHLFQQYGCSEIGCIAINPDLQDATDVGYPLPHLSVTTSETAQSPEGINVRSPSNQVVTGDLGYLKTDGMLVFVSRQDDVIDVAGLNVYPQDVEQAALAMPGVEDALVFRIDDPLAGGRVGLLFKGTGIAEGDLRGWLKTKLGGYQQPTVLRRVAEIPRQANGKTNRREVSENYQDLLIAEGASA